MTLERPEILSMASCDVDRETGFSESDIHFARATFYRDCPTGYCSKRKFLAFIRKSTLPKSSRSHLLEPLLSRQNHRQIRKFFSMMFDIYDRNHDGQLDFDEYIYALSAITGANRLRTVETLYNFFDTNHQGFITRQDFNARKKLAAQFLGQYKTGIDDNLSYDQAFNTMDTNHDGRISKEEFIHWHLQDHLANEEMKPVKRRTRLLRNLSTLVDLRGQIQTSTLQAKDPITRHPIDAWLETTMNVDHPFGLPPISTSSPPSSPGSINADRYLLKVFRQARNRFIHHRQLRHNLLTNRDGPVNDNQSDSGVFTSSSRTNPNDDLESNSLFDTDDDHFSAIGGGGDHPADELLCQSLEAVLMETLLELRQLRQQRSNSSFSSLSLVNSQPVLITRL